MEKRKRRKCSAKEIQRTLERFRESGLNRHAFADGEGLNKDCLRRRLQSVFDQLIDWFAGEIFNTALAANLIVSILRYSSKPLGKKTRVPVFDHIGNEMGVWVLRERSKELVGTDSDVKEKALEIAARENISNFRASDGWIAKMKEKNGLTYRKFTHTSLKMEGTKVE